MAVSPKLLILAGLEDEGSYLLVGGPQIGDAKRTLGSLAAAISCKLLTNYFPVQRQLSASPQSCGFHGWYSWKTKFERYLRNRMHPLCVMGTSGEGASSAMIARLLQVTVIEAGQTDGSTLVARKLLVAM